MRGSRTLRWSLAREILQYTGVVFAAATIVLVSQNLLRRMEELTAVGFTGADLWIVLRCLFPMLTAYSIPVALLFGVAMAVRRRVSDSEVLAMRACGLGLSTLLLPAALIGAAVTGVSAWLLVGVEHEARMDLVGLFNSVAARGSILQAGDFRGFGERVVYVAHRDRDNALTGVMISDRSQDPPFLLFAEHGRFELDERNARLRLALSDGEMHIAPRDADDDQYRRVLFRDLDYTLDAGGLLSADPNPRRPKQMTLSQLRDVVARGRAGDSLEDLAKQNPRLYALEIQRRFGLPFAPLLFAVAAVPLALQGRRRSRSWGPLTCGILAFSYYAVVTLLQYLSREAWLAAPLAFWIPNGAVLALAVVWGMRANRVTA